MQGTSEKRKNGYSVRVLIGTTPEGHKVYKSSHGRFTREEAREVLSRMMQEKK